MSGKVAPSFNVTQDINIICERIKVVQPACPDGCAGMARRQGTRLCGILDGSSVLDGSMS